MSRVSPMQYAFNGGELSPTMMGRVDHEIWPVSLKRMVGYAPRPQGPAEPCPGLLFTAAAPGPCRLFAFEPFVTQGYVIEASDLLLRFYTNDVLLTDGDDNAIELVSPWTYEQVKALDYEQSADVAYMFHRDVQTQLLAREAADEFALYDVTFANGPFLDRNSDEDLTLAFSGVTGTVTVTASAALFAATDVGRLIEIEAHDLSDIPSWEPGITTARGKLMQWDGRVYQVVGGGTAMRTGTVAPVHTRGIEWDGMGSGTDLNDKTAGGVELAYVHDMFGRVRITAYTSPTVVTATVTRRLPLQAAEGSGSGGGGGYAIEDYLPPYYIPDETYDGSGAWEPPGSGSYDPGTWRWSLGAFSDTTGWPEHGRVWNERLWVALDDRLYASVAGDLLNFDRRNEFGEVSNDMGIAIQLDEPHPIQWLFGGEELFIGTEKGEWVLRPASTAQGVGPLNYALRRQTRHGSAAVRVSEAGGKPVFVQRHGRKIMHMVEDTYGRYVADDLTRYADHIGSSGFIEMAWQREPLQLLWCVLGDGTLAGANYMPAERVLGWFRRPLAEGLVARSIAAITAPDGGAEQLWVAVQRGSSWWIMHMAPWGRPGVLDSLTVLLDAALTYDGSEGPISTLTMAHLAGQTVELVADGLWYGAVPVSAGGTITLAEPVTRAIAGLPYQAECRLLPFEGGGDNGPAQGKMKRISKFGLRLQDADGLALFDQSGREHAIENVRPGQDLTLPYPPITDDVLMQVVGTWDRAGEVGWRRKAPLPGRVLAVLLEGETSQK